MFHTISTESIHFPVSAHTPTHLSQPFHLSQPLSAVHPPASAPLYLSQPVSVHMSVCFSPSLPWYLIYLSHTYPSLFQRSTPPPLIFPISYSSAGHPVPPCPVGLSTRPRLHVWVYTHLCYTCYTHRFYSALCISMLHTCLSAGMSPIWFCHPLRPFPHVHTYLPTYLLF